MAREHLETVLAHKQEHAKYMQIGVREIFQRAIQHDLSKFSKEEYDIFEIATPMLKNVEYGSEEYAKVLNSIQPAIKHHYAKNDHHPEFHKNGVTDMNLFQLYDMISDWMAASKQTKNGSVERSLDINRDRFGIEPQLFAIIRNTVHFLAEEEREGKHVAS